MADGRPEPGHPSVEVQAGGPYVVRGGVPIRRMRQVESEHGEPMSWEVTERFADEDEVWLCRCGTSSSKPFCDGSHETVGFEGTEAAPTDTFEERVRVFQGTGVTIRDDRTTCTHAGYCGNRLTNVWKLMKDDAVHDSIIRAQLITMVERCPSGSLSWRLPDADVDVEPELPQAIGVAADGPLHLSGGIPVTRADGQPFETRNRVSLCRCGASSTMPLCDGSHKEVGFRDG